MMQRLVIVGATSAMAEHCARIWVQAQPVDMTLVGRDAARLACIADDLRVRNPRSLIRLQESSFTDPVQIEHTVQNILRQGDVDVVLIAQGMLPDQTECEQQLGLCHATLEINGLSPVLFAEAFARHMQQTGRGTLALLGSVAGDRGRKSNYVYGAAKGLVSRYAQGLQHRFTGTGVHVVMIKPGPTATPMTAHLMGAERMAPVEQVAAGIIRAVAQGRPVAYVPGKWRLIMMVIRHLPAFIFNRLNI